MKKTFITLACTIVAVSAFAQGTVSFNNNVAWTTATSTSRLVLNTDNATPLVGTNWFAQLYYGAQGTAEAALIPSTTAASKFRVATTTLPGTWSGGTRTLTGIGIGATATLQVRVWDGALFTTYELAKAGGGTIGASGVFDYTVPATGSLPSSYYMEGLRSFNLQVPEPTTMALAALGLGGLVFFRRRK